MLKLIPMLWVAGVCVHCIVAASGTITTITTTKQMFVRVLPLCYLELSLQGRFEVL
jgi:hypothetical protein